MLGKEIYYLNFKDKKIEQGTLIEITIDHNGYRKFGLKEPQGVKRVDATLCFNTLEEAQAGLEQKQPIADYMFDTQKKVQEDLDSKRDELIGLPEFKHLVE